MMGIHRSRSAWTRRIREATAVFSLAVFTLVTPDLVLCESGNGHAAVEPITSLCCQKGLAAAVVEPAVTGALGAVVEGCVDPCDDTPLITHIDVPSSPRVVNRFDRMATVLQVSVVSELLSLFPGNTAISARPPSRSPANRVTVLRI